MHKNKRIRLRGENYLRPKCRVGKAVCRLIIDSYSYENLIARQLVEKLQLSTLLHPTPYKVGWIK